MGADHAHFAADNALTPTDQLVINNAGTPKLLQIDLLRGLFVAGANISIDASGTISAAQPASPEDSSESYSIANLPATSSAGSSDLVAISQNGTDHAISYANLIDGLTVNQAPAAATAADTDSFWVSQGGSTMVCQTLAGLWNWLNGKLPTHPLPVVEIVSDTTLDSLAHGGHLLICSQPIEIAPPLSITGGFACELLNLSNGNVTFAPSILVSSGSLTLPSRQAAKLTCASYSGGAVTYAWTSNPTAVTTDVPGQVADLAVTGTTSSTVSLSWSPPASGGGPSSYTVQYKADGTTIWLTAATGITATGIVVPDLVALTSYDFQVSAVNAAGIGALSTSVIATTLGTAGSVTSVTWNVVPGDSYAHGSGAIGVNAHIAPETAAVQFGVSQSATVPPSSWVAGTLVNTDLWGAYIGTPATVGTWYAWVEGTDGSCPTVYPVGFSVT
jgi:hypothetical protein